MIFTKKKFPKISLLDNLNKESPRETDGGADDVGDQVDAHRVREVADTQFPGPEEGTVEHSTHRCHRQQLQQEDGTALQHRQVDHVAQQRWGHPFLSLFVNFSFASNSKWA